MSTATATIIWGLAMLVALLVHALGWRSWLATFRHAGAPLQRGTVALDCPPEEASQRLARQLASSGGPMIGRILEASPRRVSAELRPTVPNRRGDRYTSTTALLSCEIDPRMQGCEISYTLDARALAKGLETTTMVLLLVGSFVIVLAAVLFPSLVLRSENVAIRAQAVQVVQLVHFLWPPFLLTWQARRLRAAVIDRTVDVMSNLPWL